ncbi:hypothetical protein ABQZ99_007005 [Xanthomonas hortorum pv. vitians]|uniref:Uncharacterized protein n=2 Tax=Xanthomonas TaxID=338 RepID=A0ABU5Q3A6_9XANT|nr:MULTISPECIES: hypothetical protein [Xanthomonas]MEA5126182.1 hypothetical protein [Xanthomonas floridensis]MEA5134152.1 hypothetical protein [Xanthomonas floridensis]
MPGYTVSFDPLFAADVSSWSSEFNGDSKEERVLKLMSFCSNIGNNPNLLKYYGEARPYKICVVVYKPEGGDGICAAACVDHDANSIIFISLRRTKEEAGNLARTHS